MDIRAFGRRRKKKDVWKKFNKKKAALLIDFAAKSSAQIGIKKNTKNSNLFRDRETVKNKIDVSSFNTVVQHNAKEFYVDVEGMTTYSVLVDYLLKVGFMPAVVPELKSITVGGALVGVGIESSSFRYGLVHETVQEIDVLTGAGEVVTARPDNEYSDLFFAMPNSYGTLGYALRVRLKIVKVAPYVELEYLHYTDPVEYYTAMQKICSENKKNTNVGFVEGIVYSDKMHVISIARFSFTPRKTSNYTYLNAYYKSIMHKNNDCLKTYDYIWRWDADWFWCSKVFGMDNQFLRLVLGKWMLKSTSYNKIRSFLYRQEQLQNLLKKYSKPHEYVIQDAVVPIERAPEFLEFFNKNIGITPIWNCPVKAFNPKHDFTLFSLNPETEFVNFGFWDKVESDKPEGFYNKLVENKIIELGGHKSLYSDSFYTKAEFWTIYDYDKYSALKLKYDPNGIFRDLYTKCCTAS